MAAGVAEAAGASSHTAASAPDFSGQYQPTDCECDQAPHGVP